MAHRETEVKLRVPNPEALKRRLAELGFRTVGARQFESNDLYDFPDMRLSKAGCMLRLRFVNDQCVLTFKGAPALSRSYKSRSETETRIEDGERLKEIFDRLQLKEIFRYEKYRTVYRRQDEAGSALSPVLTYDETPVGHFVELEGPKCWIDEVARQLGYQRREYIAASYAALYRRHCQERGEEPGNMVFHSHKS